MRLSSKEYNTLDQCFEDQAEFTKILLAKIAAGKSKTELIKEYLLSLHDELSEILHCMNWKWHREDYGKSIDYSSIQQELIDVQKFLWGLATICEISRQEFITAYNKKTAIVENRWKDFEKTQ